MNFILIFILPLTLDLKLESMYKIILRILFSKISKLAQKPQKRNLYSKAIIIYENLDSTRQHIVNHDYNINHQYNLLLNKVSDFQPSNFSKN